MIYTIAIDNTAKKVVAATASKPLNETTIEQFAALVEKKTKNDYTLVDITGSDLHDAGVTLETLEEVCANHKQEQRPVTFTYDEAAKLLDYIVTSDTKLLVDIKTIQKQKAAEIKIPKPEKTMTTKNEKQTKPASDKVYKYPRAGGAIHAIWKIYDKAPKQPRAVLVARGEEAGYNKSTCGKQYNDWRKFREQEGLPLGDVRAPKPAAKKVTKKVAAKKPAAKKVTAKKAKPVGPKKKAATKPAGPKKVTK